MGRIYEMPNRGIETTIVRSFGTLVQQKSATDTAAPKTTAPSSFLPPIEDLNQVLCFVVGLGGCRPRANHAQAILSLRLGFKSGFEDSLMLGSRSPEGDVMLFLVPLKPQSPKAPKP